MFTKQEREAMKQDGMSFEDIQELWRRLKSHNDGTAEYLDEETFWNEVYTRMNHKMKDQHV